MINQICDTKTARECLSEIYTIVDEIDFGNYMDFLVPLEKFMEYATAHNGSFATNEFGNLNRFSKYVEELKKLYDKDNIFIAPFWFSRSKQDLINFDNVYSDTIYIKVSKDIDIDINTIKAIENIKPAPHENELFTSESNNIYIRLWWD